MAPKYKLHYFNVTSLGEPIRFLLSYANEEFEDIRYTPEYWSKHKSEMPLGKMPVLEFDNKRCHQSLALARYLGSKYGLAGNDDFENLQIDMAMYTYGDLRQAIVSWFYNDIKESKDSKFEPLMKQQIPMYMDALEEMVVQNGGYLANGKLSWADIFFAASLKYYCTLVGFDLVGKYPTLKELKEKVESIPQISAYIAKRPQTDR